MLITIAPQILPAQRATIRGVVTRTSDGAPVEGATVSLLGSERKVTTNARGRFVLPAVPVGGATIRVVMIGYTPAQRDVVIGARGFDSLAIQLTPAPVALADITVTAVSRVPERLVAAPGAVATVDHTTARDEAIAGQPALALTNLPGADVVETDVQDFNVNARGFNTVFNRRVLVLQDGRDLSIPFLGSQEWLGMTATLADMAKIEFVRGPSAALYGANAFAGVLNMTTPLARETPGGLMTLAGGEGSTFRGDLRYGGVFGSGRWGYRLSGGYSRSDAWAKSRTDVGDLAREYSVAIDTGDTPIAHPFPGYELRPLNGQTATAPFGQPGPASGTPDPVAGLYGSARLDYYAANGSIFTAEGGDARTQNETLLGSAARFQVSQSTRPWFRLAWAADRFHLMAWYDGRDGEKQYNLAAGTMSVDHSHTVHVEGQYNRYFLGTRGRIIAGASERLATVNTSGTLIDPRYDDRTDHFTGAFAQVEFEALPRVQLVGASRLDASNLYSTQFSPKLAVVYSPAARQSLRLSVGRAFEMPNSLDFFVSVPAAAPADFTALENALRASPVGPALAGVPQGTLFSNSSAVPLLALGNPGLKVERVTSWEAGYKGQWGGLFAELDGYYSVMHDFVTDVLPGVNPTYAPWTAPSAVPDSDRGAVESAVQQALIGAGQALAASALTRLQDGTTAMVLSTGNAGRATVRGLELDLSYRFSPELQVDANASIFGFKLASSTFVPGDSVLPNTPARVGNITVTWRGTHRLDLTASLHAASKFQWKDGPFAGPVPSTTTINASASWLVHPGFRLQALATNLFNQLRYQNFGGAVIGRRALAGVVLQF